MKNKYRIVGDDVFIELNKPGIETVISVQDLEHVKKVTGIYAVWDNSTGSYYASVFVNGTRCRLQQYLLNTGNGVEADHVDRDTLNNRRSNLRAVSHSINCHNQGKRKDNTSGYKGVSFVKHCGKYRARIQINGTYKYLGLYEDPKAASDAVEAERRKYYERSKNNVTT